MQMKYSIIIRVKNEAEALKFVLQVLTKHYKDDIHEIIIVDNESTDTTVDIANSFNCRVTTIKDFTYGRAINQGINEATNNNILLLSAHSVPVGLSFFKTVSRQLEKGTHIAAARFINGAANYKRAIQNNFKVIHPEKYGITAACCYINKTVWEKLQFDEQIIACEDKLWSKEVIKLGYEIIEVSETFFYFAKRSKDGNLKRWRNETLANHIITKTKPISKGKIFLIFIKNNTLGIVRLVYTHVKTTYKTLKNQLFINSSYYKNK